MQIIFKTLNKSQNICIENNLGDISNFLHVYTEKINCSKKLDWQNFRIF